MTEKQLRELLSIWQRRLGLEGWAIAVTVIPNQPEMDGHQVFMRIERSTYYDRASLTVGAATLNDDLTGCLEADLLAEGLLTQLVETSVVHELLHLATRDVMEAGDLVRAQLSPAAVEIWDGAWRRAEEATVERLAIALVRSWSSAHWE